MSYKRILVPVDGSPTSRNGLDEAAKIARESGSRLLLLHVIDDTVAFSSPESAGVNVVLDALRASGRSALAEAAEHARRAKLQAETALLEKATGRVADAIVDQAKRWRADLIVMGTHGRRGVNRLLLGSNAELVVRSSTIPVLLVPGEARRRTGRARR
ncbi:MAG TPA: universal stress protein [Burkholderiales bacterium]|jgi:nucleotide-binding universal stress UspA family protein|nr:universal stress protein [Burkholderiales bacterium]